MPVKPMLLLQKTTRSLLRLLFQILAICAMFGPCWADIAPPPNFQPKCSNFCNKASCKGGPLQCCVKGKPACSEACASTETQMSHWHCKENDGTVSNKIKCCVPDKTKKVTRLDNLARDIYVATSTNAPDSSHGVWDMVALLGCCSAVFAIGVWAVTKKRGARSSQHESLAQMTSSEYCDRGQREGVELSNFQRVSEQLN